MHLLVDSTASDLSIPREELLDNPPYAGHGFTSGKQGRIGASEFKFRNQFYAELNDKVEFHEVFLAMTENYQKRYLAHKENESISIK